MAPTPDANGNWFVNKHNGQIKHISNFLEKMYYEANGGTWVSFNTQADAQAYAAQIKAHATNPSVPSPVKDWWLNTSDGTIIHFPQGGLKAPWMAFASQADAQAYLKAHPAPSPLQQAGGAISSAASSVTSDVLKPLFQSNLWLRVVEVGLGIVLIVVGLVKLAPASVKSNIATVGKVAAVL